MHLSRETDSCQCTILTVLSLSEMLWSGIFYYNHLPQVDTRFTSCNILTMELCHRLCTKTGLHKINFLSDNINSQPFKINLTAYFLCIHCTEAHQTSNLTGFIMCSLAAHPPVNKWHTLCTHFQYFTATASLPLQNWITVCPVATLCNSGTSNILPLC